MSSTLSGNSLATEDISVSGDISFADNSKAIFGAGSDLQIYHDGSNSYIQDAGTGDLRLRGTDIRIESNTSERYITATAEGAVSLFYDNANKLATTPTGIDVTGTATMDGLTVDGLATISSTGPALKLNETDTTDKNTYLNTGGGTFNVQTVDDTGTGFTKRMSVNHGTGDISFYEDTGTTAKFFWDASAESLTITGNNNAWTIDDTTIYGDRANVIYVGNTNASGELAFVTETERMRIDSSGNVGIGTSSPVAPLDIYTPAGTEAKLVVRNGTSTSPVASIELRRGGSSATFGVDSYGDYRIKNEGGHLSYEYGESGITTERMRIDSSGNLLVGKSGTSFSTDGVEIKNDQIWSTNTSSDCISLNRKTTDGALATFYKDGTTVGSIGADGGAVYIGNTAGEQFKFHNGAGGSFYPKTDNNNDLGASSNRFKDLYLSGGVYLNTDTSAGQLNIGYSHPSKVGIQLTPSATTATQIRFNNSAATQVGSITSSGSTTAYNTSSDYRLKEDWIPVANASDRVAQLKPVNFAWKASGERVDGFLAHELAEVIPEAVTGEKDAMRTEEYEASPAVLDDDGNVVTEAVMGEREVPDYQGIDQSKLVPLLTAALQEALIEIDNLKQRVNALENN